MALRPSCECGDCGKCRHRVNIRRWRESHPENAAYNRLSARASRERRLEEVRAYDRGRGFRVYDRAKVVARSLARVIPLGPCEVCGEPGERHHEDYSKPLDVRLLCRTHHGEVHRIHGAVA